MSDPRFARLRTDPRFRRPKKHQSKVVVDERFKSILDKKAKSKSGARVDKYGRKVSSNKDNEDLRRFYKLEEEEEEDATQPAKGIDYARGEALMESSDEEEVEDDVDVNEEVTLGPSNGTSKSTRTRLDESPFEIDLNEEDESTYADLDAQAAVYAAKYSKEEPEDGARTRRLAVVNLDWDHVRASHLYKIFSSLVSPTVPMSTALSTADEAASGSQPSKSSGVAIRGKVLSVVVYPSEFGKGRMAKEEAEGPPKEIFKASRRDEIDPDEEVNEKNIYEEDEGDEYDEDALRKYQLERLRYFYAVVTCDSVEAASHIYTELDGTELERSANVFDLSFVPDDMTFDDQFRDEATLETDLNQVNFKGLDFSTDALRHSKVKLTWDDDDPERNKVTRRTLTKEEIEKGDFRAFIASSESEGSEDEAAGSTSKAKSKKEREKLRALLLGGGDDGNEDDPWDDGDAFGNDKKGEDKEMEITFMPALSGPTLANDEETTLDKYKRKQKEKRNQRKQEREEKKSAKSEASKEKDKPPEDDFFGQDSDQGDDDDDLPPPRKSKGKQKEISTVSSKRDNDEKDTELSVQLDRTGEPAEEIRHFDMKAVIKAEKLKGGKKKRRDRKKGSKNDDEIQEDFQIDVKDERFKSLHEDHSFAIDPSNPHFTKTSGMTALLDERAKRRKKSKGGLDDSSHTQSNDDGASEARSLQSLVASVKRKSVNSDNQVSNSKKRKL